MSAAAAAAGGGMIKVAIIGTAGRKEDGPLMSKYVYDHMFAKAKHVILKEWKLNPSHVQLVSGGAAWTDHIVVQLFLEGTMGDGADCPPFPEPIIHFPCGFDMKRMEAVGSQARTVNALHREFSKATERNSLSEIASAVHMGATLTTGSGFKDRNTQVADCDYLLAFTWSLNEAPKPGGTNDTWEKCTKARVKKHIPIGYMLKVPLQKPVIHKRHASVIDQKPQVEGAPLASAAAASSDEVPERPTKRQAAGADTVMWETQMARTAIHRHSEIRSIISELFDAPEEQLERKPDTVITIGRLCADYDGYRYGLSPEQRIILMSILAYASVFITGSAGVGKSTLLNQIIETLKHRYESDPEALAITASTGTAGTIIHGLTIHSWSGCGYFNKPAEEIIEGIITKWKNVRARIQRAKVLILDETPMISAYQFSTLSAVISGVRGDDRPFGGLQLIVAGDFLQLPPVSPNALCQFAFEAPEWDQIFTRAHHYHMMTVHRQNAKPMVRALNKMRLGVCDAEVMRYFEPAVGRKLQPHNGIIPTKLYAKRVDVREENERELARLPGELVVCKAKDEGDMRAGVESTFQAPAELGLKVGAQVMFLYNDTGMGLVNGSRGVVIRFEREPPRGYFVARRLFPVVRFMNGVELLCTPHDFTIEEGKKLVAMRTQVPLMLAWALTIHKSQGQTLDCVEMEIANVFDDAMAYVATSRCTNIDFLSMDILSPCLVHANPTALAWYSRRFGLKYGYPRLSSVS